MITFLAKLEQEQGGRIRQNIRIDVNRCCRRCRDVKDFRVHVHDFLGMERPLRKAFTTDLGQMQWRRYHMTAHGL